MQTPQTELIQLGSTITNLREAKNWSLDELAAASGLKSDFIGDVEAGFKESTVLDIVALAKALGVSTQALLEQAGL